MLCGSRRGMFDHHSLGMGADLSGMLLEFVLYRSLQIRVSGFMLDRSIQNLPYYLNFAIVVCVWRVVFDLQTSREDKKISVVRTIWIVHPFDLRWLQKRHKVIITKLMSFLLCSVSPMSNQHNSITDSVLL